MDYLTHILALPVVRYGAGIVVTLYVLRVCARKVLRRMLGSGLPREYKPDVVYVHMFPRSCTKGVVNLSPFAIKLETWLRLNKIQYQVVETNRFSKSTGQIPYIILNGEELADSSLIMEHLSEVYQIKDKLTPEQTAVTRAFTKMLDEHTCWTYFLPRYVWQPELFARVFKPAVPWPLYKLISRGLRKSVLQKSKQHGIGRKTRETINELGKGDLCALSEYLEDKQFMMGQHLSEVDCVVFGHLSQILYVDFPYVHKEVFHSKCANLVPYMDRIKTQLWPEWDRIIATGTFS